ncbi:MFS transporter [Nocardioides coralli]|uniref:MFS transporter n=1 Tax=Nocardioides coralli TaxID=2872154 RepID=UPI001CA42AE5|nr:MFS transporter [Nocardioides coralli]QZY30419.1 MFS transporter [Nocardioides coralli]
MSTPDVLAVHRRTLATLVTSQAVGAVGITIGVATASLLARDVSGSESQAGLAQTAQVLGAAVAAYALARGMARRGRRVGLATGLLVGAAGAALCVVAGVVGSMPLLLLGALMLGSTSAANAAARYAATDLAPASGRARALSLVVWATTLGAVVGPNLAGPAGALAARLGIPELTGPFALAAVGMALSALVLLVLLRPDPLLLARELSGSGGVVPEGTSGGRALAALRADPVLAAAVVGLASAHAVMISVMIMTPLHMEHGGAELRVIGFVISGHVLGMFAFAPVMGWLTDRWGRSAVILLGAGLQLSSLLLAGASPEGSSWQITVGLFLLGLGWSAATVAGSAVVADRAPLSARTDVQGVADMTMWLVAAGGGALSGVIVGGFGYPVLNGFAAVLCGGVVLAGVVTGGERRDREADRVGA